MRAQVNSISGRQCIAAFIVALAISATGALEAASTHTQVCLTGEWSGLVISGGQRIPIKLSIDAAGQVSGSSGPDPIRDAITGYVYMLGNGRDPAGNPAGVVYGTIYFYAIGQYVSGYMYMTEPGEPPEPNRLRGKFGVNGTLELDISGGTDCIDTLPPVVTPPPPGAPPSADVTAEEIKIPNQIVAGRSFTVSAKIINKGRVIMNGCDVALFGNRAIPSGSSSGADAIVTVPPLIPGASQIIATSLLYDRPGRYTLAICVDPDGVVSETNRLNNTVYVPINVISPGPDVAIGAITTTETNPGLTATFNVTVENRGGSPASSFDVAFFSNRFTAPASGIGSDGKQTVSGLLPGGSTVLIFTLPLQNVARAGNAWFLADSSSVISDEVPGNNANLATWGVKNNSVSIASAVTASKKTALTGEAVVFTLAASDPDGDPLGFRWNFGDGFSAFDADTTSHAFTTAGIYTISVDVTDGPFSNTTSSVQVEIFDSAIIDLGTVSLSSKKGKVSLLLPPPQGQVVRGYKSQIVAGTPGNKAKVSANRLRAVVTDVGIYRFSVEYSKKKNSSKRVSYQFTVVP